MREKYTFINPETGKQEEVPLVRWRWVAHYADKTILKQYDDNGIFHRFAEIREHNSPVIYFQMVSNGDLNSYKLAIPVGADLIHFYRNTRLAGQTRFHRGFIFGWKILIKGRSHERLIGIRPDDTIALLNNEK